MIVMQRTLRVGKVSARKCWWVLYVRYIRYLTFKMKQSQHVIPYKNVYWRDIVVFYFERNIISVVHFLYKFSFWHGCGGVDVGGTFKFAPIWTKLLLKLGGEKKLRRIIMPDITDQYNCDNRDDTFTLLKRELNYSSTANHFTFK